MNELEVAKCCFKSRDMKTVKSNIAATLRLEKKNDRHLVEAFNVILSLMTTLEPRKWKTES